MPASRVRPRTASRHQSIFGCAHGTQRVHVHEPLEQVQQGEDAALGVAEGRGEAVGEGRGQGAGAAFALFVLDHGFARAQLGDERRDCVLRPASLAQRLPHHHRDRQRVAAGEVEQRLPRGHVQPDAVPLGQPLRHLDALLPRHGRQRDAAGQVAQPAPLVAAGGQQEARPRARGRPQEVRQLGLLRGAPAGGRARGEARHRLHVVPDPEDGNLPHDLQRDVAALRVRQRQPVDAVGLQQRVEQRAERIQRPRQRQRLLERGEDHRAVGQPAGGRVPARKLGRGRGLAAARIAMHQRHVLPVERPIQRQQRLVAAPEPDVRRRRHIL